MAMDQKIERLRTLAERIHRRHIAQQTASKPTKIAELIKAEAVATAQVLEDLLGRKPTAAELERVSDF